MARGIVCLVNPRNGMVAIDAGEGNFTVAEITDIDGFELGDEVHGDLESHGGGTLIRARDGRRISVYIQAIQATAASARTLTLGR